MRGDDWVEIAVLAEIATGKIRRIEVEGLSIALITTGGAVHAVMAACPHRGGPLDEGTIVDGSLECPWHHFRYDLETGVNIYPANVYPDDLPGLEEELRPLALLPVRVEGGRVFTERKALIDHRLP
jgi:nitrite reductase/ring-hydroxylating ferredoxin subunit